MRLIDADAFEKSLANSCESHNKARAYVDFLDRLDDAPTVDAVQRVHGKWIDERRDDFSASVKCSCCNYSFYFVLKGQLNIDKMPYCPKCCAMMDGGNNGAD